MHGHHHTRPVSSGASTRAPTSRVQATATRCSIISRYRSTGTDRSRWQHSQDRVRRETRLAGPGTAWYDWSLVSAMRRATIDVPSPPLAAPPPRGSRTRPLLTITVSALAVASPWTWFLVRDSGVLFDVAAVGLPLLVAGAAGLLAVTSLLVARARALLLAVAASVLLIGVVAVLGPWLPQRGPQPTSPLRVASANVLFNSEQKAAGASAVIAVDADVVIAVEATPGFRLTMADAFAYASTDDQLGELDEIVYARWPIIEVAPLPGILGSLGVRAVVQRPEGRFAVYAIHLFRPWLDDSKASVPFSLHRRQTDGLRDLVEAEQLPTVLAGDLNLVDRTSGYRALVATLRDAGRSGWVGPTTLKTKFRPLLARIDHIFVTRDWCAADGSGFEIPGSDHRGVVADVGPCPAGDA